MYNIYIYIYIYTYRLEIIWKLFGKQTTSYHDVAVIILVKNNVSSHYTTAVTKKQQKEGFKNFLKSGRGWKKGGSGKKGMIF